MTLAFVMFPAHCETDMHCILHLNNSHKFAFSRLIVFSLTVDTSVYNRMLNVQSKNSERRLTFMTSVSVSLVIGIEGCVCSGNYIPQHTYNTVLMLINVENNVNVSNPRINSQTVSRFVLCW